MRAAAASLVLLALAGALRADAELERAFQRRLRSAAAGQGFAVEAWTRPLAQLPAGWSLDADTALPQPGAWRGLEVGLARGAERAVTEVKVKLWPCVKVLVLSRPMAAGQALTDSDLGEALVDPRAVGGKPWEGPLPRAARLLKPGLAGEPLLMGQVASAPDRRAGDTVLLKVHFDGGDALDEGRLLQDASEGQKVTAQNARSGRLVQGRLVGGQVMVED